MRDLSTICMNCGHVEGEHAQVGDSCPEGNWYSAMHRFCAVFCVVEDRYGDRCGREPAQLCIDCGCGVCIRCVLNCFECAEPLHDHCRDEHAKSTGHRLDGPKGLPRVPSTPLSGGLIDALVDAQFR